MLDHLDDIDSDLSVFHRIEDPLELGSPRYFQLASRLHHYDGAVRAARGVQPPTLTYQPQAAPPVPAQPSAPAEVGGELLAELSDNPGFPSIEYKTGG